MIELSIITTFYNAEKYIKDCIESVNKQILSDIDFEYILVDDMSQDDSRDIIEKYIETKVQDKSRWKIVTPENNLGCGGARKFGIDNSRGKYLMFLDADDYYINNDFCKRAISDIKKYKADIVEYGMKFNMNNGTFKNIVAPKVLEYDNYSAILDMFLYNNVKFQVWCKIIKRNLAIKYPYDTSRTFEDIRTIPIWVGNSKKIVIMPSIEINYRASEASIIRDDSRETRYGTLKAMTELCDIFFEYPDIIKAIYGRALIDLKEMLLNHTSEDKYFNEISEMNTKMLSLIYPETYKEITYNLKN